DHVVADVADPDVLDVVPGDTGDAGRVPGVGVVRDDVTDADPTQEPDRYPGRTAHPRAEPEEERHLYVTHGDIADRHVLHQPTGDGLQGQAPAVLEDDVGDGDVPEAAIGLGAELDPPGPPVAGGGLERTVDQGAQVVPADHAVVDGYVLGGPGHVEGVRALQH